MIGKAKFWSRPTKLGIGKLVLLSGFVVLPISACTTTSQKASEPQEEPIDPVLTEDPQLFGSIDDENEQYQWSDKQYEDKRFAAELENSPLSPYEPKREDSWVVDGKTGVSEEKPIASVKNKQKKTRKKIKKEKLTQRSQVR